MYDEDRWPSGFCGGAVQQEVGSLKGLTLEVADQGTAINGQVLAVWAATLSGEVLTSLRHFSENDVHTGEKLLIARLEGSASSPWFNGNPPPDNLDPHSEEAFIRLTHGWFLFFPFPGQSQPTGCGPLGRDDPQFDGERQTSQRAATRQTVFGEQAGHQGGAEAAAGTWLGGIEKRARRVCHHPADQHGLFRHRPDHADEQHFRQGSHPNAWHH